MKTHIQKWGNSLGIRIPKAFVTEMGLSEDSSVEITVMNGQLVITPTQPGYTLDDLLSGITQNNLHGESDTGAFQGNEVW